ncbi:increased DNA methylation 1-like [Andrographis paniculata]|uniref:increased DNA methylation 1-like n=1 Tax=Andrographis paniculata TaxID=175694 RepID=UPI0021E78983|nr:increased DNA methylation 1-like [Andrographis paniculata]XP_051148275.1 increased DNA methylation 1-like [Andrographis paniculata]XP_051148276.1 increased DNA methylation 1-like [Andrographis paniculata]
MAMNAKSHMLQDRSSSSTDSSGCRPSGSGTGAVLGSSSQPKEGKLTRKNLGMHKSLLATEAIVPNGTQVWYIVNRRKFLEGSTQDGGILCSCCNLVVTHSRFEEHAGFSLRKKAFMGIYTKENVSLHDICVEYMKTQGTVQKECDTICCICHGGGDLLSCKSCPRGFHLDCVELPSIPEDKWHCRYCENSFGMRKDGVSRVYTVATQKYLATSNKEGKTLESGSSKEVCEDELYSCAICRGHDFVKKGFTDLTVIICEQCEKEFHVGCLRKDRNDDLKEFPKDKWFCCMSCSGLHSKLENLAGDKAQKLPPASLDILRRKSEQKGKVAVKWSLLSGSNCSGKAKERLSNVVTLLHEQFGEIKLIGKGIDLVPEMVYGKSVDYLDFFGMHCIVLTVKSNIVCAGIIRIFGEDIAELPLIATKDEEKNKGYCSVLFSCIEHLLSKLNVERILLPAISDAKSMWMDRYGFEVVTPEQLEKYLNNHQKLLMLENTTVLHKSITQS